LFALARRTSRIPRKLVDRGNPPPDSDDEEEEGQLEYDIYGWFNFDSDAPGVKRLDRQWVALELAAQAEGWLDEVEAFEQRVVKLRAPLS